ncbi:hypothetical protein WPS_06630 [Vulcanimicrobium alpinum]|uniref:Light-harvesting protein n=1 Tax=Vulcanimicrobium alpinum TaxID=3016050 RepID=A0AAN1XTI5_UNVUL|nr:hypothetical protein [Vulcanimicrobium alpinum]BDE05387.1 hypothetical protein WPS_06630 [Vulcanimicrobium alpinum]
MAVYTPAANEVELGNDQVPDRYRAFFDNGDWSLHSLVVQGSWLFFIVAVIFHIFFLSWHP